MMAASNEAMGRDDLNDGPDEDPWNENHAIPSYAHLVNTYPSYAWNKPTFAEGAFRCIGAQTHVTRSRRTIKAAAHNFSYKLWPIFTRYINALKWDDDYQRHDGCTFAELVIDFEVVSGMDIQDLKGNGTTTWAKKAEVLKIMFENCPNIP